MNQKQSDWEIVNHCLDRISRITEDRTTLQVEREKSLAYFYAEPDFDQKMSPKKGFSSHVSPDVRSKISSLMPMLLKPFVSSDEIFQLQPRTEEDVEPAQDMEALVDYYMRTRNDWGQVLYDVLQDACLMKNGYIGYEWKHTKQTTEKTYEGLTYEELLAIVSDDNTEVVKLTERMPDEENPVEPPAKDNPKMMYGMPLTEDGNPSEEMVVYDLKADVTIEDSYYPCIRAIKAEDVGHDIEAKNIKDCSFVWENIYLEEFEIREQFGDKVFEKIKNVSNGYQEDDFDSTDIRYARVYDLGGYTFIYDSDTGKYKLKQCYYRDQRTGKHMLAVICGHILCKEEENNYKRPPIIAITTYRMAHRVVGLSQFELIKEYQKLNTQLKREIMNHFYYMNRGRWGYDPTKVKMSDFYAGNRPGGSIPMRGIDGLKYFPSEQLPNYLPQLIQMWEQNEEIDTGITKYNQGSDSKSLNKTARGMQMIMSMSMQRVELMLTFISWGLRELTKEVIDLLIKNMEGEIAVRVLNREWKKLKLDNISGSYDISIKVGIGIIEKDFVIQQLQQLIALSQQMQQLGIFNSENAYNLMKLLIQSMGFKNYNEYITDPQLKELLLTIIQITVQATGGEPQVIQLVQQVVQLLGLSQEEMMQFGQQMQQAIQPAQPPGRAENGMAPLSPLPPSGMVNQPG